MHTAENPQNPYRSFMVSASAGSGKTYQLSQRFLNLVAAGVAPEKILTVTFTKKAAGEMRARIVAEACTLAHVKTRQQEMLARMSEFHLWARSFYQSADYALPTPLPPQQVGQKILTAVQQLKITTIDALFKEWIARFPYESMDLSYDNMSTRISRDEIADQVALTQIDEKAWATLFSAEEYRSLRERLWQSWQELEPGKSLSAIRSHLQALGGAHSFIWLLEKGRGQAAFADIAPVKGVLSHSVASVMECLREVLTQLVAGHRREPEMLAAVVTGDYDALVDLRVLTQDGRVHGGTFRGKQREAKLALILQVEDALRKFWNRCKVDRLNICAQSLRQIFEAWCYERDCLKRKQGLMEFDDLARRSYQLFHSDRGIGAAWFVSRQVHHILLDEFQDTSQIQWSVFSQLMSDWLSGASTNEDAPIPSSVFVVGDPKQSIYGFRMAEPEIMNHAADLLAGFEQPSVQLSCSYRAIPLLMDVVNRFFRDKIEGFPLHATAKKVSGQDVCQDVGSLLCSSLFEGTESQDAITVEMEWVAQQIQQRLAEAQNYPVFDKDRGGYRPLALQDICVLYRNSTHTPILEQALVKRGIPCRREENKGFFNRTEVHDVLSFVRVLIDPQDIVGWITLLRSPIVNMPNHVLLKLCVAYVDQGEEYQDLQKLLVLWQAEDADRHAAFMLLLRHVYHWSPHGLLLEIYRLFGVFEAYRAVWNEEDSALAESNLLQLVEVVHDLELSGYTLIPDVCVELDRMAAEDEMAVAVPSQHAVTLMTVHKSKGLEYPCVFVTELGSNWFREDTYWLRMGQPVPKIVFVGTKAQQPVEHDEFDAMMENHRQDGYAESLRLLYVAMTRASQYLVLSGHCARSEQPYAFYPSLVAALRPLIESKDKVESDTLEVLGKDCALVALQNAPIVAEDATSLVLAPLCTLPAQDWIAREVGFVEKSVRQLVPYKLQSNGISDALLKFIDGVLLQLVTGHDFDRDKAWWNLGNLADWIAYPGVDLSFEGILYQWVDAQIESLVTSECFQSWCRECSGYQVNREVALMQQREVQVIQIPWSFCASQTEVVLVVGFVTEPCMRTGWQGPIPLQVDKVLRDKQIYFAGLDFFELQQRLQESSSGSL
ncbi:MAG: UvrD-helicase domain-containing protein [Zetaproteobacteria bacterium]|nr:UvrD-helicase domain-containing protein [Zetaproteobacteria bacterium]